ncbi:carbohydrate ABC transporter permease [Vallitalea pronyensis]|uniref:Carbohydrate ABC transporter permease n=1 Tax=Vallitalea pronyensis TaxID=1348613 RepID=A0A8J8MJ34_9FIRM|nr:carbohydrate ABC transporter permease [Vallitalea pronyensis]QUI22757.1 carbohydrate ABC transporter permease [Vallitalea pronyensis]
MKMLQEWHNKSLQDKIFSMILLVLCIFVIMITLYPMLNVVAISFNDSMDTMRGGINMLPRKFSTYAYASIFDKNYFLSAVTMSVLRTLVGVGTSVPVMVMVAYVISRKEYVLRGITTRLMVYTMYVSAGIIPIFFLMRTLHLTNSFWVYIIPPLAQAYFIIITRTYILSLPDSIMESAKLDGANHFTIIFKIIFPLVKPVIATLVLFVAVQQWNNWYDTFLYNSSNQELSTLQYELKKMLAAATIKGDANSMGNSESGNFLTPVSIRAAMTVVVSVPIMAIYPFLQKYFVGGLVVGGVKE